MTITPPEDKAILQTLLYADIFDYSLTAAEVHHYLIGATTTAEAVREALEHSPWLATRVAHADGFFTLCDRTAIVRLRDLRQRNSRRLWPQARCWAAILGGLPFVRMVAVTGALAMNNARPGDDIDFLIVTAPGRVWLTRALVIVSVRLARLLGVRLCPNYVLSQSALREKRCDLYVAHDLAQMVPLVGWSVYAEMRAANPWAGAYLPQARQPLQVEPELVRPAWQRFVQRLGESLLGGPVGDRLEAWEYQRKLRRWATAACAPGVLLDAEHVKGHFDDHDQAVLQAFEERLARYGS